MPLIVGNLLAQLGFEDDGFTDGMRRAESTASSTASGIERAEDRVRQAYSRRADATRQVRAAEEQLRRAQASGSQAQIEQASRRLADARTREMRATNGVRTATDQLRASQAAATQQSNLLAAAASRARAALSTVGVGVGIAAAVEAIKRTIVAASDLQETGNALQQLFGADAPKIEQWAEGASKSMAMSQTAAREAATSMALYGRQANLTGDNLVNFSTQMSQLAGDLASFSNTSPEQAIEALGAAFRGESDPIEQYGVLLNETTLKNGALKDGLISTTSEAMSPAIRVQAVYNEVLRQTTAQQGDFARTGGEFSNKMKTMRADMENMAAGIGEKLLPIADGFITLLSGLGDVLGTVGSAFNSLPGPVQAALAAIVAFRIASRFMGTQVSGAVSGAVRAIRNLGETTTIQARVGTIQMGHFGSAISGIGRHIPIVGRMQTAFVNAATEASRFPRAAGAMAAGMAGVRGAASGLMGALGGPWGLAIAGATTALTFWMQKKQEDAAKSQEAKAATQEWADALLDSKGAIDDTVRQMAVKKIAETDAYETVAKLGIGQDELTDRILSGRDAFDAWYASLIQTGQIKEGAFGGTIGAMQKVASEIDAGRDKAVQMARANGDMKVSFDGSREAAGAMSEAMSEFEESTDGAASKVDKLAKSLSELQDDQLTQEEALQQWSDGMRDFTEALGEGGAAMVKLDGHIDVTTEKGSKLQDTIVDQRDAFNQTAAAALEFARSTNMPAGQALDYVNGQLAPLRQQMIDTAIEAGVNADQARKMADAYLGVPGEIVTKMQLKDIDAALDKIGKLKIEGAKPVQLKYTMLDNTAEVRKRLDEIDVKYSIIDGKVVINQDDLEAAQIKLGDLGVQTETLPDGFIKITDTSDENIRRLVDLGVKVQALPDGTIVIDTDDADFWRRVNEMKKPEVKEIHVRTIAEQAAYVDRVVEASKRWNADGSITEYADGGIRPAGVPTMPTQAVIETGRGAGLVRWAEGETGWEAYIPGKKTARTYTILAEAARRLGFTLAPITAFADGGITTPEQQSMWDAVRGRFGDAVLTSATRSNQTEGHADYHNSGQAIDISGGSMGAIASWIAQTYPGSLELIHSPFNHNIKDGRDVGDGVAFYGAGQMAAHQDHVHWALGAMADAAAGSAGGGIQNVTLDGNSSREDVARKIIAEGRTRGYSDAEIQAALATAIQESNLDPNAMGGGGAWHGVFQQDSSYTGRDDPNTQITGFYDRLDEKKAADPSADIWDQIFWLQQRPGESTAAAAVANGRSGYMDEIKSRDDEAAKLLADLGPSVGTGMPGDAGGVGSQVYVTGGHLDSIGSGYTGDSTGSSSGGGGDSGPSEIKPLFSIGGGRFYNPDPKAPKGAPAPSGGTGKTSKAPSASSVQSATDAVGKARRTLDEVTEKRRIAEMKLDEVRANPKAKPSQIAAAEAAVARARNDVTDATEALRRAEMKLREVQDKGRAATSAPTVKRQHGGTIPGTGRGDIVPMMGEPGEEVIRRDVATLPGIRAALQHLNATGQWPERHQDGGTVGGFTSGFGGYTSPTVAKVGLLDRSPASIIEQVYRLGVAGFGAASMIGGAFAPDGSFQGLSTGASTIPILDDIVQKLDEVIKEGRVGSIGMYVGEGGQIVVADMGELKRTQDDAANDAMLRSAAMRA